LEDPVLYRGIPRRIAIVVFCLDVIALMSLSFCVQAMIALLASPEEMRFYLRYVFLKMALVAWICTTHYGIVTRRSWGRESGLILLGMLLLGACGGGLIQLLPLPNRAQLFPSLMPLPVYVATASVLLTLFLILFTAPRSGQSAEQTNG
jgi:hypothetical protein